MAAATPDDPRPNLYGMDEDELVRALEPLDTARFRARQVFGALYRRDALDPAAWTELSAGLRAGIGERFRVARPRIASRALASDGTLKVTVDLPGGGRVESVAIREPDRTTFCISSQVGCAYGCAFCMTARLGFGRHLSAGEIAGQVAALAEETGVAPGAFNVVFMGQGEPLHNFDGVMGATKLLLAPAGFALGPRRVTISTVGLVPRIHDMARAAVPVRLAVSLVVADQDQRAQLMPVAKRYPLPELADAIRAFGRGRRDRPTLEVVLLRGVNDALPLAHKLADFARAAAAKVNLIEYNPTPELPFAPAPEGRIQGFLRVLKVRGITGTVRRSRGRDAFAACGQLAFLDL